MSDFEMTNTQGCIVAVIGAVTAYLGVGSFITQLNITQPARLGEGRPLYTFKGWTNLGTQISGEVLWYDHANDLSVKVIKIKLKLNWQNDWRPEGKPQHGQFECEYDMFHKKYRGKYVVIRM